MSPITQHCQNMSCEIFNPHTEYYSVVLCAIMCCYVLLCSVMYYYYVLLFAVGVGDNIYRKRHERGATTNEACNVWDLICLKGTNRQSSCSYL